VPCSRAFRSSAARPDELLVPGAGRVPPTRGSAGTTAPYDEGPAPTGPAPAKHTTRVVVDRTGLRRVQCDFLCARRVRDAGARCAHLRGCVRVVRGGAESVSRVRDAHVRSCAVPVLGEPCTGGAIAHIKLTCCRKGVSGRVPRKYSVTPVTVPRSCLNGYFCTRRMRRCVGCVRVPGPALPSVHHQGSGSGPGCAQRRAGPYGCGGAGAGMWRCVSSARPVPAVRAPGGRGDRCRRPGCPAEAAPGAG
jgi:hypothetical protein